jgi:cytochrome c-type biogenesis protein CcmH/NrfG
MTGTANLRAKLVEVREIEKTQGLPAAERAIVDILREGPQTHQGFIALARILMKQRRHDEALRAAQKAHALSPLEVEPLVAVGLASLRQRDHDTAAQAFAEAIRLDPRNAHAHLGAAAVKLAAESYDDALELCERVIDLDPEMERAHELMARINMQKGDKDDAIAELQELLRRNPENRRAMRAYLRLMRAESREDDAFAFLEAEAEANPDDRRRAALLVKIGARVGRAEYATEEYERRREQGEVRTGDRVRYAMSLIQAGDIARAREVMAEMDQQAALQPVVAKLEGDIAYKAGNHAEALAAFRNACSLAGVEMLSPEAEAGAADEAALSRLWRAHARQSIMSAVRDRRAARE